MSDQDLRKTIIKKLRSHTEYNSSRIVVRASLGGLIELIGHADGEDAVASIEGIVRSIEGVTDVANYLKVNKDSYSGVQGLHIE